MKIAFWVSQNLFEEPRELDAILIDKVNRLFPELPSVTSAVRVPQHLDLLRLEFQIYPQIKTVTLNHYCGA